MFQFAALPIAKAGMASFIKPMLVGAGVGALGGLLTGQDPLKAAAVGGATAGLFQGLPAGSWMGGGAEVAKTGATTGATLGTGGYAAGANPAAFLAPTGQEIGMANAFNMATNAPINVAASAVPTSGSIMGEIGGANLVGAGLPTNVTTMQDLAAQQMYGANNAMLGNPLMGGINPLSEAQYAQIASTPASSASSLFDDLKPYANIQNLTGAAMVADRFNQRPQMPTAPSGGISRGQAPQGTDVMALLASIKPREQRRISLL
jgi:hypothetical protein